MIEEYITKNEIIGKLKEPEPAGEPVEELEEEAPEKTIEEGKKKMREFRRMLAMR